MTLPEHITPRDLLAEIELFSITERGRQTEIGVSEVGMACTRCLLRKLANVEKEQLIGSWRAQLGTYVHDALAKEFESRYGSSVVLVESKLIIHEYKSLLLKGSCDVFFPNNGKGLVVDWKIVGDDTLSEVAAGRVKQQYVTQINLYAWGFEQLGHSIDQVAVMFLPANKGNLSRDAVPYSMPYNRTLALEALAKLEHYIDLAEEIGWDELLRRTPPLPGCLSCRQYVIADSPVRDLLLRP